MIKSFTTSCDANWIEEYEGTSGKSRARTSRLPAGTILVVVGMHPTLEDVVVVEDVKTRRTFLTHKDLVPEEGCDGQEAKDVS